MDIRRVVVDVESFDATRAGVVEVCGRIGAEQEGTKTGSSEVAVSVWQDVFDVKKFELAAL
jgi:hypothetical protein